MDRRTTHTIRSILFLAGAFTFAFLLGEAVHEMGHYLGHLAYRNPGHVQVKLDPFGGSRISGVASLPDEVIAVTAATGPLSNLALGLSCLLLLWPKRRPILLPLLLWGALAAVQEGVTFSLGLLVSGGDAAWIAAWGVPKALILTAGILLLLVGAGAITLLLPLAGVDPGLSYRRRLGIVLVGMWSLMLLRSVYSLLASPASIVENLVPLLFAFLLAGAVTWLQGPLANSVGEELSMASVTVTWPVSALAVALGTVVFIFQVAA
jgi:hypothetical protein